MNKEQIAFVLLIGMYIAPLFYMANKKKPKNEIEEQNEFSKLWLTVVTPILLASVLGAELVLHISEKASYTCRVISVFAIIFVSFSVFCWGTALWLNVKNSKIKKDTDSTAETALFKRKSKYNTVGVAMFFISIGLLLTVLISTLLVAK